MSIRVNLLPHREARRERKKRLFYALWALSALAGGALVLVVGTVLNGFIGNQQQRNDFIVGENRKLDAQIKEISTLRAEIDALRARQRAVEDLQADRNQPVYLFDELTKQTPEGVYLRTIKQEDRKVSITGWAASNERVSEFLRNLQNNSRYIERPDLIEIKIGTGPAAQNVQRRLFDFALSFTMRPTPERAQLQSARSTTPPAPAASVTPVAAPAAKK